MAKTLSHLTPSLRLYVPKENQGISRDKAAIHSFAVDPLSCHFSTVKQGVEILNAFKKIPSLIPQIKIPTLLAHGSCDRIVLLQGSCEIFQKMTVVDKEFHIFPGAYHELHNDLSASSYFERLAYWFKSHL